MARLAKHSLALKQIEIIAKEFRQQVEGDEDNKIIQEQ